mgnify:FL=1
MWQNINGPEDVKKLSEDQLNVLAEEIRDALLNAKADLEFDTDEVNLFPTTLVDLDDETKGKFNHMLEMLAECEDVQAVHHNANIEEEIEDEE